MTWEAVVVPGLAAFWLSWMLVHEDGPWRLFVRLRDWSFHNAAKHGQGVGLFQCHHCLGVWIAVAFWLAWQVDGILGLAARAGLWGAATLGALLLVQLVADRLITY